VTKTPFMRWIKTIVIVLTLLTAAGHATAQVNNTLAYQTVQPSRIKVGDSAIIRVISYGRLQNLVLPTIPGLTFEDLGRSQGLDFLNGTAIPATWIQVRVTAQFAGNFSIPGFAPGSQSIGLEVVNGDEPNPYAWKSQRPAPPKIVPASLPKGVQLEAGGAVFIHMAVPTRDVYVGESVPVDIEVGLRAGIVTSVNGLPTLKSSDFTLNNLSKHPERREQLIDGGTFIVLTWHSVLAAVKPGDFSMSVDTPLTLKLSTLSAADRAVASRLAYPLLQSMYNGVAPKEMTITSAPSHLKVLPLPDEGRPDHFSGAVGHFQVSSDISPAGAAAGDPLTLRLHVGGAGNFDRVDAAMLDHLDHWRTYPPKSSFTASDTVGYQGEKVFEQPLIAAQPGDQSIPALAFDFFNPDTRQYERAQTTPISVTIAPSLASGGANALTSGQTSSGFVQGLREDHPRLRTSVRNLTPLYFRTVFLTVPAILALLLAGLWFAMRRGAQPVGSNAAARAMAPLEAAVRKGNALSFLDEARSLLLRTFATRWQMPADQINAAVIRNQLGASATDVVQLLALADETRYAGYRPDDAELERWLKLVRSQLMEQKS
jgi:hypothetical protein